MTIVPAATRPQDQYIVEHLIELERAGALTPTSLVLTNPDFNYETWESLGRFFGQVGRSSYWWLGDWLIFGEDVYGEIAANAVDPTTASRYSLAERVTGYEPQTLMNIRSICARVARPRRRIELGFWIHEVVAPLEADDQTMWLQAAIDNGWTMRVLRDAIRAKNIRHEDPPPSPPPPDSGPGPAERIKSAALLVVRSASVTSDGDWMVSASSMAQLAAALGEELA